MLRERAGAGSVTLELPEGASVRDALDSLADLAEGIPLVMAVNREYASEEQVLGAGDELALIPPVSGGETALVHVREPVQQRGADHLPRRAEARRLLAVAAREPHDLLGALARQVRQRDLHRAPRPASQPHPPPPVE